MAPPMVKSRKDRRTETDISDRYPIEKRLMVTMKASKRLT